MVTLFIKGNRQQAKRAAKARGVHSYMFVRLHQKGEIDETVAYAHPQDLPNIERWFAEIKKPGAFNGYPTGTLLYYKGGGPRDA